MTRFGPLPARLIWLHGARAQIQAADHADKMFLSGDITGFHKWNRVKDAIKDIEKKTQQHPTSTLNP